MDTPEVERMTSLELVAPTAMSHGVVVLFHTGACKRLRLARHVTVRRDCHVSGLAQLSYIRKGARRTFGQYRGRLAATC